MGLSIFLIVTITSDDISRTLDNDIFMHLARTYASNHAIMYEGTPCHNGDDFPEGITNGYAWYRLKGKNFVSICLQCLIFSAYFVYSEAEVPTLGFLSVFGLQCLEA